MMGIDNEYRISGMYLMSNDVDRYERGVLQ